MEFLTPVVNLVSKEIKRLQYNCKVEDSCDMMQEIATEKKSSYASDVLSDSYVSYITNNCGPRRTH